MNEEDQATQISRFLKGYREGRTLKERIRGPSLLGYINSLVGINTVYLLVFVVVVVMVIQTIKGEEPLRVGTGDQVDHARSSVSEAESREYGPGDKVD